MLSFISQGLQDFSVSRSQTRAHGWGIPVPDDPSQVMYVWFDALTNYISAIDYADEGDLFTRYWLDNPHRIHALGKGVIRFHAIYWPAMLLSAGIPLPETEFVHGYINIAGAKMSKSLWEHDRSGGVGADLRPGCRALLPAARSISDARCGFCGRGWLPRSTQVALQRRPGERPGEPGESHGHHGRSIRRWNGSGSGESSELASSVRDLATDVARRVEAAMLAYNPQLALEAIWELVTRANKYVEESAPWVLSKVARDGDEHAAAELEHVLFTLAEAVRIIGTLLEPFLPDTAQRISHQLGLPDAANAAWNEALRWGRIPSGTQVASPEPLFPRLEIAV